MKSQKWNLVIIAVLTIILIVFFTANNRNPNDRKDDGPKTDQVESNQRIVLNNFVSKNLGGDWTLGGMVRSPLFNNIVFSVSKFNSYSDVENKIYTYNKLKNNFILIKDLKPGISYYLRPELWRADNVIEVAKVSSELEHPYDIFEMTPDGQVISEPKFMPLFRINDFGNRYFVEAKQLPDNFVIEYTTWYDGR